MYTSQRTQKTEHGRDSAQLASLLVVFVGGHSWQLPDHVIKSDMWGLEHHRFLCPRLHVLCACSSAV